MKFIAFSIQCTLLLFPVQGFSAYKRSSGNVASTKLFSAAPSDTADQSYVDPTSADLDKCKSDLLTYCQSPAAQSNYVLDKIAAVERLGEQNGIGQGSSYSGLLAGEWELVYAPEDITRSSPFFWAFRKAFPDSSDQIFGITDAIPDPLKVVGPAYQSIDIDVSGNGSLISRVKVATLGGVATSIMTTRATLFADDLETVMVRVDTTKPEESTILKKLGPLGDTLSKSSPAFPSGEALERVKQGSSTIPMLTTFCDGTLRISCYNSKRDKKFVWKRTSFKGSAEI